MSRPSSRLGYPSTTAAENGPSGLRAAGKSLRLDRVLCRDDKKRGARDAGFSVDRDLFLFHALQQAGLGTGSGAVDFVSQQDVGKHRAGAEGEPAFLLVEKVDAGEVGRQQVGGELHTAELRVDRPGQRFCQPGLAGAGDVLEQHMPARDQSRDREVDDICFADDDPGDVFPDASGQSGYIADFHESLLRVCHVSLLIIVLYKPFGEQGSEKGNNGPVCAGFDSVP
jgi:hypothetical protein